MTNINCFLINILAAVCVLRRLEGAARVPAHPADRRAGVGRGNKWGQATGKVSIYPSILNIKCYTHIPILYFSPKSVLWSLLQFCFADNEAISNFALSNIMTKHTSTRSPINGDLPVLLFLFALIEIWEFPQTTCISETILFIVTYNSI